MVKTKRCPRCKIVKSASEFHKNRNRKDGLHGYCKICVKPYQQTERYRTYQKEYQKRYSQTEKRKHQCRMYAKKYRANPKGKQICEEYQKSENGKKVHAKAAKKYATNNPKKIKAYEVVARAIKLGAIQPPNFYKCLCCRNPAEHYHHPNGYEYEHRLDVIPLCIKCHVAIHYNTA